jgi:diacylglycerol kinase (ATP)
MLAPKRDGGTGGVYPRPVRAVLAFNSKSGLGRGRLLASRLAGSLHEHGVAAMPVDVAGADGDERLGDLTTAGAGHCVLVAVGGDGTVRRLLPWARQPHVVLAHLGAGNENLFARGFGLPRRPEELAMAIAAARRGGLEESHRLDVMELDLADAAGRVTREQACIMLSSGPDSIVVRRLDSAARGMPGHLAYVVPVLGGLAAMDLPRLKVEVDGKLLTENEAGWLMVANMADYALGLNPCGQAKFDDGLIDVLFVPRQGLGQSLELVMEVARQGAGHMPGAKRLRGSNLRVSTNDPAGLTLQADGDMLPRTGTMTAPLCEVRINAVRHQVRVLRCEAGAVGT